MSEETNLEKRVEDANCWNGMTQKLMYRTATDVQDENDKYLAHCCCDDERCEFYYERNSHPMCDLGKK